MIIAVMTSTAIINTGFIIALISGESSGGQCFKKSRQAVGSQLISTKLSFR